MTYINITDLTKNEELDQESMRAVCGGWSSWGTVSLPTWSSITNFNRNATVNTRSFNHQAINHPYQANTALNRVVFGGWGGWR